MGNYGERAAERVTFEVLRQPLQRDGRPMADGTPLQRGIRYLPPGRGYRFWVSMSEDIYNGPLDKHVLDVKVTYGYGGTTYDDRWTIDFADFEGILLKSFRDSGDEIARSVKELAQEAQRRSSQDGFSSMFQQSKRQCPSCATYIPADAKKCNRCFEWLPQGDSAVEEPERGPAAPVPPDEPLAPPTGQAEITHGES